MATVTIDGTDYEVTPLSPAQRNMWDVFLLRCHHSRYWTDLVEATAGLSPRLQEVVVARSSVPPRITPLRYFELGSRVESTQYLVNMTIRSGAPEVTPNNAAEIFLALACLILDRPVVLSGGEALAKLTEDADAQRDR